MTPELRNDYLEALDIPEFLYNKNDSIPKSRNYCSMFIGRN